MFYRDKYWNFNYIIIQNCTKHNKSKARNKQFIRFFRISEVSIFDSCKVDGVNEFTWKKEYISAWLGIE